MGIKNLNLRSRISNFNKMKQEEIKFIINMVVFIPFIMLPLIPEIFMAYGSNNYRVWEAVSTNKLNIDRPFYVDLLIHKEVVGDLGVHTEYSVYKNVTWQTDKFGYRNNHTHKSYDIIVIGDSFIAGGGLTQVDTYPEVLSREMNMTVYSFASSTMNEFLLEKRFIENPPKIVIFESIEKNIFGIPEIVLGTREDKLFNLNFIEKIEDYIDYVLKLSYYRSQVSKIKHKFLPKNVYINNNTKMLFYIDSLNYRKDNLKNINKTLKIIKEYNDYFLENEIEFYFMPIPDKETIYTQDLPFELKKYYNYTNYIDMLYLRLEENDIKTIKLYESFDEEEEIVFQLDDIHWNKKGVEIAVDVTKKVLNNVETI